MPRGKELLTEQRDQLKKRIAELESTLARLNKKIENYESKCIPFEEKLKSEKDRPITKSTKVHFAFAAPKYIDTNDLLC